MYVICEDCFVNDFDSELDNGADKEPVVIFAYGYFDNLSKARDFADKMCIEHNKRYYVKPMDRNYFGM